MHRALYSGYEQAVEDVMPRVVPGDLITDGFSPLGRSIPQVALRIDHAVNDVLIITSLSSAHQAHAAGQPATRVFTHASVKVIARGGR